MGPSTPRASKWKLKFRNARYSLFEYGRLLDLGYTAEHLRVSLQFAITCGLASIFISVNAVRSFYIAPLWVFILIPLISESLVGEVLLKTIPCAIGLTLGAGLGIAMAAGWQEFCFSAVHEIGFGVCSKTLLSGLAILGGFLFMLFWARFPAYPVAFQGALVMYFTCLITPEIDKDTDGSILYGEGGINSEYFKLKALTLLAAVTGTVVTIAPSVMVLPNTANRRLRGLGGHVLESLGNTTVSLLSQFLQDPVDGGKQPGRSGTDEGVRFVDDGLEKQLQPLAQQIKTTEADLYTASKLLPAARAEERVFGMLCRTHPIPLAAFTTILSCCKRIATEQAIVRLSCMAGRWRLGLCNRHRDLMKRVQQDLATVFTALAVMVHASIGEEHVAEKFRNLGDSLVELFHGVTVDASGGFDADLETFALYIKTCITFAHQMALVFRELSDESGKSVLAYIAASFAETMEGQPAQDRGPGPPAPRASIASLAGFESSIPWASVGVGAPVDSQSRRSTQVLLDSLHTGASSRLAPEALNSTGSLYSQSQPEFSPRGRLGSINEMVAQPSLAMSWEAPLVQRCLDMGGPSVEGSSDAGLQSASEGESQPPTPTQPDVELAANTEAAEATGATQAGHALREMVMKEGRARNWSLWDSLAADPGLRAWLQSGRRQPSQMPVVKQPAAQVEGGEEATAVEDGQLPDAEAPGGKPAPTPVDALQMHEAEGDSPDGLQASLPSPEEFVALNVLEDEARAPSKAGQAHARHTPKSAVSSSLKAVNGIWKKTRGDL